MTLLIIRKTKSLLKHCKLNVDYWFLKGNTTKKIVILSILLIIAILNGILSIYKYNHNNINKIELLDNSIQNWDKYRNYGVVVDAGSSGSRVQIYSWRDTKYLQTAFFQHNLTFSQLDGINNDGLPLIEKGLREGDNWQYKINRGISTFQDNPSEVGPKHIKQLMDPILKIIPSEKISSTPIYIYATAGMRLLPEDKRKAILSETCSYLKKNYKFLVDCDKQILNISGEEEGLYGWLGLNYLKNGFSASSTTENSKKDDNNEIIHSYGVLDMGGASTQIAYDVSQLVDGPLKDKENIITTNLHKINGEKSTYNVYSTTFLGFGMNETRRRYLEALLKKGINYVLDNFDIKKNNKRNANSSNYNDDQYINKRSDEKENENEKEKEKESKNSNETENKENNKTEDESKIIIKGDGINGEFTTKIDKKTSGKSYELIIHDPCIPIDAKQNDYKPIDMGPLEKEFDISNWKIDIKGTGDLDQCLNDMYPLLNKTVPCEKKPCLFNGVHSPVVDFSRMPFYGISEYWYTSQDVHRQGGQYNYDKFYKSAKELCKTNWSHLDANYNNGIYPLIYDEYLLYLSCFRSAWIMTVLHEGIGISKNPTFDKRSSIGHSEFFLDESIINEILQNEYNNNNNILNIEEKNGKVKRDEKEKLVPFTSINQYKGYEVSWTLGVILNYICSTINETFDHIELGDSKKFTFIVFLLASSSIVSFVAFIGLIIYSKYGSQRLQYTEILPIYDNNSGKMKNRYREIISLDNITINTPKMNPTENFNALMANPKINEVTRDIPFRVNSDLQQYLSGQGTPNALKRVNSFTAMKKNHELV